MARKSKKDDETISNSQAGGIKSKTSTILEGLFDKLSMATRGSARNTDLDIANDKFNSIVQTKISQITSADDSFGNSFLGQLYRQDKENNRNIGNDIIEQMQLNSAGSNPQDFFNQSYRNRMMKQAMADELSKQLIELRHAKNIMADVINSADTSSGTVMRKIVFKNTTITDVEKNYLPIIETMESKFATKDKIKDFITPNLLTYGEYYVYTIPYYHLFNDFIKKYRDSRARVSYGGFSGRFFESVDENDTDTKRIVIHPLFEESGETDSDLQDPRETYNKVFHYHSPYDEYEEPAKSKFFLEEELEIVQNVTNFTDPNVIEMAKKDLTTLFTERITVVTEEVPLPIFEDGGLEAYRDFADQYITEDGSYYTEDKDSSPKELKTTDYYERKYAVTGIDDGIYMTTKKDEDDGLLTEDDIKDCYIKMVPPTRMIPVKLMDKVLMYIHVKTSPATSLSTLLSYTSQVKTKDPNNKMDLLLDDIASRVVAKFDKNYIKDNLEFKSQIVAALEYYDISNTNIHFQAVPVDYVTAYKINVDVDGNGRSMLENSLFYGNIYMSLFTFKLLTIFQNSNDKVIHYVRRSGIDKNLWNDVQDIIRRRNSRKITPNDLYSHSTLLNKIGMGNEEFVGMTKNGARPIESEIVSGQQVDLDTPLMERSRTNYILSSEVPSAIMNYLNEADFAKSIETANTKMNSKASSLQLSINKGHTDWYRKLLKFSTNVPDEVINTVQFVLPEPKGNNNVAQQDLINNYQTMESFILKLFAGENMEGVSEERKKAFLLGIAKMHLNGINFEAIEKLWDDTAPIDTEVQLKGSSDDTMDMSM